MKNCIIKNKLSYVFIIIIHDIICDNKYTESIKLMINKNESEYYFYEVAAQNIQTRVIFKLA